MDGQVIGVSSVIVSPSGASVGIGFAIPSEIVSRIVAQLLANGSIERGWLGVSVEDRDEGVMIAALDRNGPAAKAGVRAGDVVVGGQRRPDRQLPRPDPRRRRGAARQQRAPDGAAPGARDGDAGHCRPPAGRATGRLAWDRAVPKV